MRLLFSLLAAAVISSRGEASTFRQFPEQGFSLVIPDGFSELTGSRVPAGSLAAYVEADMQDGRMHPVISLQGIAVILIVLAVVCAFVILVYRQITSSRTE